MTPHSTSALRFHRASRTDEAPRGDAGVELPELKSADRRALEAGIHVFADRPDDVVPMDIDPNPNKH
jgi:hypothetical protein